MKPTPKTENADKMPSVLYGVGSAPVPEAPTKFVKSDMVFSGILKSVDRKVIYTNFKFLNGMSGSMYSNSCPEWFSPGNQIQIRVHARFKSCTLELLKTMPTYKLTNEAGTVTIQTPDGKTLATIPEDQAKTFADVEAAIWEQNKGKGNGEECVEATNYFLIHGIKAK